MTYREYHGYTTEDYLITELLLKETVDRKLEPKMTAILATNPDGIIGRGPDVIPWICAPDMRRFKERTTNGVLVLGYRTFIGLAKKPWLNEVILPKRDVVVITFIKEGTAKAVEDAHKTLVNEIRETKNHFDGLRFLVLPAMHLQNLGHQAYDRMRNALVNEIYGFSGSKEIFLGGGANTYNMFSEYIKSYEVTVVDYEQDEKEADDLVLIGGKVRTDLVRAGIISDKWNRPEERAVQSVKLLGADKDEASGVSCKFLSFTPM